MPEGETKPKFKSADLRFASALSIFAATRLSQLRRLSSGSWGGAKSLAELMTSYEKEVLVEALHEAHGDLATAAKRLGGRLSQAAVYASVEPLVVVTHASAGPPTSVSGVRFLHVRDLVRDLTGRSGAVSRGRAQRAARSCRSSRSSACTRPAPLSSREDGVPSRGS